MWQQLVMQKIIWQIQRPRMIEASPETVRSSLRGRKPSSYLEGPSQIADSWPHELKRNTPVVIMEAKLRQQQRHPQQPANIRQLRLHAPRSIRAELVANRIIVVPAKA